MGALLCTEFYLVSTTEGFVRTNKICLSASIVALPRPCYVTVEWMFNSIYMSEDRVCCQERISSGFMVELLGPPGARVFTSSINPRGEYI